MAERGTSARRLFVRGVVQGVGFRPFVYRLAHAHHLGGWVRNAEGGVEIHLEGARAALAAFLRELRAQPPPAARIARISLAAASPQGHRAFVVRPSERGRRPTVRIAPDLPTCEACLRELRDPRDRRHAYPYINCTDCGPRYSIVLELPYDRAATTMAPWPLCAACARVYHDPLDRRFHAQPVACAACGPHYRLRLAPGAPVPDAPTAAGSGGDAKDAVGDPREEGDGGVDGAAVRAAAALLRAGRIVAVKGLGGYHLACDATRPEAVAALRERKFRKEKPFALMVADPERARSLVELAPEAAALLASPARPIVLAPAVRELPGVAPGNRDLGVMLPYTPLHHLLFDAGAPAALVMTSANRSSEPIAYRDDDALARLAGIADAFLLGERPIARRVDDSVARPSPFGPLLLRRSRGYAPGAAATLPGAPPIVALGADLKNTVTVVVDGQAFVSQHLGDLEHHAAFEAFAATVDDLVRMYELPWERVLLAHDSHPQYRSTQHALELPAARRLAVQHHRAHCAAVLAERGEPHRRVLGIAFDGTGYGDDGAIWGGEFFAGSLATGLERVAHLRYAALPGGDAAARHPLQAAAGFLAALDPPPDPAELEAPPFGFGPRHRQARALVERDLRCFPTTSVGRLFDTVAALLGFTRPVSFEAQAAIWLEQLARDAPDAAPLPLPLRGGELDFRPLLEAVLAARRAGRPRARIARAFHLGLARGVARAAEALCEAHALEGVVLGGGVFQNALLLTDLAREFASTPLPVWVPRAVPPNDGGVSLGQAALAAVAAGPEPAPGSA